jgi:hypothetical protein
VQQSQSIVKFRQLPSSQDFNFLRQMGLTYIQQLGSDLWTDYNLHDPGITILEVLCYAITELGYRTHFDIQDILSRLPDDTTQDFFTAAEILTCNPVTILDFRKLMIDQIGVQNGWLSIYKGGFYYECSTTDQAYDISLDSATGFAAKELNGLYTVSLQLEDDEVFGDLNTTVLDWQIPNISGQIAPVKVVLPAMAIEFPFWDDPRLTMLGYEYETVTGATLSNYVQTGSGISFDLSFVFDGAGIRTAQISGIRLLKDSRSAVVINQAEIETEFQSTGDKSFAVVATGRLKQILTILRNVYCVLHQYRNLCEDYVRFQVVRSQDIAICADITVQPDADLEDVLAQIYFEVDRFLAPPVRFYSLAEMRQQGKSSDQVFEGLVLEHGFIDSSELQQSTLKTEIHVSDLYRIIMAIAGVVSVKDLLVTNYLDGVAQTNGEPWCLQLGGEFHLNFRPDQSRVLFYKDVLPFRADKQQVARLLRDLKAAQSKPKLQRSEQDLPIPKGNYRYLSQYVSIQNDFPQVYGIGAAGLPSTASELRKAQAKQLKAFLMVFDQLLANYFAQLDEVKNLFSASAASDRTYAVQPLYKQPDEADQDDFPDMAELLKPFVDSPSADWDTFRRDPNNGYLQALRQFAETDDQFADRKNRILDHLIARFGESFTDYAVLMYSLSGQKSSAELIRDKQAFLSSYPEISRERGKAFQYQCYSYDSTVDPFQSTNIAGLQKRLCRLLGIDNYERRRLGYAEADLRTDFTITGSAGSFGFQLTLASVAVLQSSDTYATEADAIAAIRRLLEWAVQRDRYTIRQRPDGTFEFDLSGRGNQPIATHGTPLASEQGANDQIQAIITYLEANYFREGMHLFEHILLRPVKDATITQADIDAGYYPECKLEQDCNCPIKDYYSFRITIVLPYWPLRFRSMDFRQYVERTIHMETPAHILPKICWIDPENMTDLENRYANWLAEATKRRPARTTLFNLTKALIQKLNKLTTVYPEGVLHDCDSPAADDDAVILNRTQLGTFEDIEDGIH